MIFATLSNKKYLLQGIALAYSLRNTIPNIDNYKLYYLCLDEETFDIINAVNKSYDLRLYPILGSDLDKMYPQIQVLKSTKYSDYCFSFSALLPLYIFKIYAEESAMYIDSDTYFYHTPKLIYEEIGSKDVGIIRHRHNDRTHGAGEYNANVMYFKNNDNGNKVLNWWHIAYMTKNPYHLSGCGDQKFLEGFEDVIGKNNVCVVDDIIGHGAPWNFSLYNLDKLNETPKKIVWNDKEQIFVFNHFSQFEYNFEANWFSYTGFSHLEYTQENKIFKNNVNLHNMYADYYVFLKQINEELNLNVRQKC